VPSRIPADLFVVHAHICTVSPKCPVSVAAHGCNADSNEPGLPAEVKNAPGPIKASNARVG
jgi:hypothetical protein